MVRTRYKVLNSSYMSDTTKTVCSMVYGHAFSKQVKRDAMLPINHEGDLVNWEISVNIA